MRAPQQTYAFNRSGLLGRLEYSPALGGVPANVNYAADHQWIAGLTFATRRCTLPADPDGRAPVRRRAPLGGCGRARREPALMTIDVDSVEVG